MALYAEDPDVARPVGEPRSVGNVNYPQDPFAPMGSQEPRSLVIPAERPAQEQSVGLGVADIPARLVGTNGVYVKTHGLDYLLGMDIMNLQIAEGAPDQQWLPVWVEGMPYDQVQRVPVNAIPTDAPKDGQHYNRQDGAWVVTFGDAPHDGEQYARRDGLWDVIVQGQAEWDEILNKPDTFPPTLPIPPDGVIGLVEHQQTQDDRIAANENEIIVLDTRLDTVEDDVSELQTDVTALQGAVAGIDDELDTKLGDAPSDGKTYGRKDGTWTPAAGAAQISDSAPVVADDATFWWDSDSGPLYIRYNDGDSTQWVQVGGTAVADAVTEAPVDGKAYARKNADWSEVDVLEAPIDGKQYAREDGGWSEITIPPDVVTEAPIDGNQYVRQDGDWAPVEVPPGTIIADAAPTAPPNSMWWSSSTGVLSIRYDDGNSQQWVALNGSMAAAVVISDAPPATTFPGMLWWESDTGELSIRYNDGDSEQWVSAFGGATTRDVYSTTETLTDKVWIDGKPIYRKVVDLGFMPNATSKTVAHGIVGLGTVVSVQSMCTGIPMPYADTTPAAVIGLYLNGPNIVVTTGSNRSASTAFSIIEYTKA